MKLVRVVSSYFVAGFETDGTVIRTAPILRILLGKTDEQARRAILQRKWVASVVAEYDQ